MTTLVIADIHGRDIWKKIVDQNFDRVIFLGDYFDSFGIPGLVQLNNFEQICQFKKDQVTLGKEVTMLIGNHDCYAENTEFLTEGGWKIYDNITESDRLAQFDSELNITYSYYLNRISKKSNKMIMINGTHTKQLVTHNHDVIIDGQKIKASEIIGKKIKACSIAVSGHFNFPALYKESAMWFKLLAWIISDGTIVYKGIKLSRIQFKLSKDRKINALRELLNELGVKYTIRKAIKSGVNKLQPYYICIYTQEARRAIDKLPLNSKTKTLTDAFLHISINQWNCFANGLLESDASRIGNRILLVTINLDNIDIIQRYCLHNGINASIKKLKHNASGFNNGKQQYYLSVNHNFDKIDRIRNNFLKIEEVPYNGKVVCFTMPLGTLITRLDGKIAFSGNCHYFPEIGYTGTSGYQSNMKVAFEHAINTNRDLLQMCFVDEYSRVYSHAGISKSWLQLNDLPYKNYNINDLVYRINELFVTKPHKFNFYSGDISGYGQNIHQSPIWIRPESLYRDKIREMQIVGHTTVEKIGHPPKNERRGFYLIDALGTSKEYLRIIDGDINIVKA